TGNAGNIRLQSAGAITMTDATISTQAISADGGNIEIQMTGDFFLEQTSITTAVGTGEGAGGNIAIAQPEFMILNGTVISANAFGGPGGNITLDPDQFVPSADSAVTASSQLSNDGVIRIVAPETDLSASLQTLSSGFAQGDELTTEDCQRRDGGDQSRFVIEDGSAVPLAPQDNWIAAQAAQAEMESSQTQLAANLSTCRQDG
ncbi:MAG: hypothetical protein AB8B96_20925, partial [Lysobacterales bacterium]